MPGKLKASLRRLARPLRRWAIGTPVAGLEAAHAELIGERNALKAERRLLRAELDALRPQPGAPKLVPSPGPPPRPVPPLTRPNLSFTDWVREQIAAEPYFFQKIELAPGIVTPGWSDPLVDKQPYFGLPERLDGLRVLDIGCAEGYFSFEAERRGAREVVAIDSFPESVRRFNLCRAALGSQANAYLANVYELSPRTFGTFDLVLFYGVFYHLRHPHLALEKILSVCTGTVLFQTYTLENEGVAQLPMGQFHPHGFMSGKDRELWDPTVFWFFNPAACLGLLEAAGFVEAEQVTRSPFVARARSPVQAPGLAPDQTTSPWS
jgi:2-polyprenyl-3-methyl-5-hydroxy-6-metoxy-1,4-benzoquinol methylase